MVLADLRYGTTACKWDSVIPFDPWWEQYGRIAKPTAAIVLTASQPFTTTLIASNLGEFRYSLVWEKEQGVNFLLAKKQPMKSTKMSASSTAPNLPTTADDHWETLRERERHERRCHG